MRISAVLGTLGFALLASATAQAHFILEAPQAATMQDDLGNPQKTYPCGPNGAGEPTGAVSTYQAGSTISVTIDETIFHPGHYRVSLAVNDASELPPDPPITATPNDECAMTVVQDPPVFPVLADGMIEHSQSFNAPQTFEVTLPSDVTCDNCTLQVMQYMSNHGAPCFYYHCATIAIQDEPVMTTAASSSASTGAGAGGSGGAGVGGTGAGAGNGNSGGTQGVDTDDFSDDGGCACGVVGTGRSRRGALALLLLGGLALRRRRE